MKLFQKVAMAAIVTFFIAGCKNESDNTSNKEKQQGVIPEHQLKALENAKALEQTLKDEEEKRRKEMEDKGT